MFFKNLFKERPIESYTPEDAYYEGTKLKGKYKHEEAYKFFEYSAENGYAPAQYMLGEDFYYGVVKQKDCAKAMYWYEQAALNNDTTALLRLHEMYYYGYCGERNKEKALYWCEKAAELDDPNALLETGRMYEFGEGCKKDEKKALYWYEKAGKYYREAMIACSMKYEEGLGCKIDYEKALYWAECYMHKCYEELNYYKRHNIQGSIRTAENRARQAESRVNSLRYRIKERGN